MSPAPLTTRDIKRRKGTDEIRSLKRRVGSLARLDREIVHLEEGPVLVRIRRFREAALAVKTLRTKGRLDRATLEKVAELESAVYPVGRSLFAELSYDLIVLASPAARVLARGNRRAFTRAGGLDRDWLEEKGQRLAALRDAVPPERWTDGVIELVNALRGAEEAHQAARAFATIDAEPMERRAKAIDRVLAIAGAMESGVAPDEVSALYERLDAARDFPGRAKKRRMLDVLRRAIGWADLPADLVGDDFLESARRAIALWPIVRDEDAAERFAILALVFRLGSDSTLSLTEIASDDLLALREHDLTLDQATTLRQLTKKNNMSTTKELARHVAAGLDLELVRSATPAQLDEAVTLDDVRSVRAYLTWSTRLRDHYTKHGLKLDLSPKLFCSLPRNEDLAVLTHCLLDHHAEPTSDPIGILDATLGLFQRLPSRALALVDQLRRAPPGEGRRIDPELANWLDDDALLDRSIHIAKLSGEPEISAIIREDFDRNARRDRERAHLLGLAARSPSQQRRLDALGEHEVPKEARRARTLRRLRERIDRLLPRAYRRGLDETFRRILREGWGIRLPKLTDAWREAVRFWLLVEDNRDHLEKLLREAALRPGRSVKDAFPHNVEWLAKMKSRIDVDAWTAPRRRPLEHAGARYLIELEEDPLEVLRMGIPFATCLSLESGSNAASTVLNAIDVNKRVLYVRNASGKIVARKLLGINDLGQLIGYRLYRSVGGEEERAIAEAVATFCEKLGQDCHAPLTGTTAPEQLHRGFWYDDGDVPFEAANGTLARFCEAHGLTPPTGCHDEDLVREAEAWAAHQANDVEWGLRLLENSSDSPAMRVHDAWTIRKLGLRRAIRAAQDETNVTFALFHSLAVDEPGLLVVLEAASRVPQRDAAHRLGSVLERFPPSLKTSVALVDLALRGMRQGGSSRTIERGLVNLTLEHLPSRLEDVANALDLLDAVEPAWRWLAERAPEREVHVAAVVERAASIVEESFERAPEPDVVVASLMSRRRGDIAHRAALRVAARHWLPGGDRALRRFAVLRPERMKSPDGFAALLRQSNGAIDPAEVPVPDEAPFAAMRELVALRDVHRFLGAWDSLEGDPKDTWEGAWRRRRRNDPPGGYDAVMVEEARKKLASAATSEEERTAARELVLETKDGAVVNWTRLVATCARLGDAETARRVLEEVIGKGKPARLAPRVLVDLWRLGEHALVARSFKLEHGDWSSRVWAAEREGAARGVDTAGLLEAVAVELSGTTSPDELVTPDTFEQLQRALGAIAREAPAAQAATIFANLEDALSVITFRDALAKQPAERVAAIKEEFRKRDESRELAKTFFTWIRDIGGIESA